MNIEDYDRQISYYEKRIDLYSNLIYRLAGSFSFKTHSWYRSGRVTKAIQQFFKSLSIKKKDSIIEYLDSLYKENELDDGLESYKWDKIIRDTYSICGENIDNTELYKLSSDFSVSPIESLDKLLQDYKYFFDRIEILKKQKKEVSKDVVNGSDESKEVSKSSYTQVLGEVNQMMDDFANPKEEISEIENSAMLPVDKANRMLARRSQLTEEYSTTYDFFEAIKNVLACSNINEKNNVESQIEFLFTLDKLKSTKDIAWLKELADKTVDVMILYIDSKVREDVYSNDITQFLNDNNFGRNIQIYNDQYEQLMNSGTLTEEQKKELITPEQLIKMLNNRLSKIVKERISLIPEECDKNIRKVSLLSEYMSINDIANVYQDIVNNEISNNDDSYEYQEAKDLLQYVFASVIVKRMDFLNDLLTEEEIKEEEIKRKSSICIDYFHEKPSVLINPQGNYSSLEGYAKEKLKDAKLVSEQMAKYYNESKFKQSLSNMNFSRLAQMIKKGDVVNE